MHRSILPAILSLLLGAPAGAVSILAVERVEVIDDGDRDGILDTGESVQLFLTLRNTSPTTLPAQGLRIEPAEGAVALGCFAGSLLAVPALAAEETVRLPPVTLLLGDVDRFALGLGPDESLTLDLDLSLDTLIESRISPSRLSFDLDLDLSGGGAQTLFLESFESGTLGAFVGERCDGIDNDCSGAPADSELDLDGDGYVGCLLWTGSTPGIVAGGDCNDGSGTVTPLSPEINDGLDNQCDGLFDELPGALVFSADDTLEWPAQGGASAYDVARSPDKFLSSDCTLFSTASPTLVDPTSPPAGGLFFYSARSGAPFVGSYGSGRWGAQEGFGVEYDELFERYYDDTCQ